MRGPPVTVLIAFVASTALAQAPTRLLSGTVLDSATRSPIASAQLHVRGTSINALSGNDGTFSLPLPLREIVLEIRRIGYPPHELTVPVGRATLLLLLTRDALRLDQVVVSGQATAVSRRNLANSVASVTSEELTRVSTQSVDQAFQGKIAGAQISSASGAPGGGTKTRIRGISSIIASAPPLYVVDGVIVTDISIGPGTATLLKGAVVGGISGGTSEAPVNRIADLNPHDIESVEVLKGAASAAIYGSKASGGVILITTKRGLQGRPRVSLRTGIGTSTLAYRNGQRRFQSLADAKDIFGDRIIPYWNRDSTLSLNYETLAYSNRPVNQETSLSASGGNENTRYFVSGILRDEEGIVHNTFARKYGLRVNLDQTISARVSLQLGSEVLRTGSDRGLFGRDLAGSSVATALTKVPAFLDLRQRADGSWPRNEFYPSNPLETIALLQNREWVWRFINTARINAELWQGNRHALRFLAYGGADVLNQRNTIFSPPELQYEEQGSTATPGTTVVSYSGNVQSNMNLNLVHHWWPRPWLTSTTQLGTQFEQRSFDQLRATARNLSGGLQVVTSGTVRDVDETRLRVQDFGLFAQTEVLLRDRLFVTIGMRADRSSNNADPGRLFWFPKASASYRFSQLRPKLLDDLKLRLAYGETGNQPLYGQKFTSLLPSTIDGLQAVQGSGSRSLTNLRPERQRELEAGIDATILGNTGTVELTGFLRNVSDLLVTQPVAPTSGYDTEISNGGRMQVWGMEVVASFLAARRGTFSWTTHLNWGANRSRITALRVPPFVLGAPEVGAGRIEVGKSPTQIIGHDTVQGPAGRELVTRVIGDGNPRWNAGWGNDVQYGAFTLYALFDRQLGGMLTNGTWREYDAGGNSVDYDQRTANGMKIGEVRRKTYQQVTTIYYNDASYLKLRELTVGWDVPPRLARSLWSGAESAAVRISGRNLVWWTTFRGGDPEAQNWGVPNVPDAIQRNREVGPYPSSKSYWLTLSVTF